MIDNANLMQNALYCAAYCEENVWHLLGALLNAEVPSEAVIVTNAKASVLYFQQRAAPEVDDVLSGNTLGPASRGYDSCDTHLFDYWGTPFRSSNASTAAAIRSIS